MKFMPVGVDIAKDVMQVHYVDENTGEIFSEAITGLIYEESAPEWLVWFE